MAKAKKQNFFVSYFKNFGLKQLCDLLMLGGAIVLLVGLFTTNIVVAVGLGIYIVAAIIAILRSCKVLFSGINKRSPEYKASLVNAIVMAVILALAIFGFVYAILT